MRLTWQHVAFVVSLALPRARKGECRRMLATVPPITRV